MALQTISSDMSWPGGIAVGASAAPAAANWATIDAAGEYIAVVIQASENMVISHVSIHTAGTASGSPTLDIRIETVDASGVPSGTLWATNTNIVTGTLATSTNYLNALTASATINKGQYFAVKAVYNSGTSVILRNFLYGASNTNFPYSVTNVSGSAVKNIGSSFGFGLASSATTFYCVQRLMPATTVTHNAFNNTNGARRGLRFKVPFKCRVAGLAYYSLSTATGDFNAILMSDAGSELSSSSTARDGDYFAASNSAGLVMYFDNDVELAADTWYRAVLEPSSATNISLYTITMPSADYISATPFRANAHYTTYASSAWDDTNTAIIPVMGLLINQLDDGVSTGGGGAAGIVGLHGINNGVLA